MGILLAAGGDCDMVLGAVDRTDSTYLHEQGVAEIRRAIAGGEAKPGERIPQAKDLAAILGANTTRSSGRSD